MTTTFFTSPKMTRYALGAALMGLILSVGPDAFAEAFSFNPLQSYKVQFKQLQRDCIGREDEKYCVTMIAKYRKDLTRLRALCKTNPDDERCGAIMKEKHGPGWAAQKFCFEHPHAKKCVVRRERRKRREKTLRKFCVKKPDAKRCQPKRQVRRHANFFHYCKSHEEDNRCKALMERMNRGKKKPKPVKNVF